MRVMLVSVDKFYYVGAFFRRALEELGYEYAFVDEGKFLEPLKRSLLHKVAYRLLGRRPLTFWAFNKELLQKAQKFQPDVVLVTKGAHISPRTLGMIKKKPGLSWWTMLLMIPSIRVFPPEIWLKGFRFMTSMSVPSEPLWRM